MEEQPDGSTIRYIRARLTVRGFKDRDADKVSTYAGTSTRYSQRLVASIAAIMGWDLATADISKAFLQGVSYDELAQITGEPKRDVCFDLPKMSLPALRSLPGYQDFDPSRETLRCLKPGTGLKDAPQAFSLKLSKVTEACGLKPVSVDPELVAYHRNGALVFIMSKHVDDLKFAGVPSEVTRIMDKIQEVFGELRIVKHKFTNCGVRHIQDPGTKGVTLDQEDYIAALKPLVDPEFSRAPPEQALSERMQLLYMSLLGAVAYAMLTRIDAAVYVAALQRVAHAPLVIHVRRLNAVTRWM